MHVCTRTQRKHESRLKVRKALIPGLKAEVLRLVNAGAAPDSILFELKKRCPPGDGPGRSTVYEWIRDAREAIRNGAVAPDGGGEDAPSDSCEAAPALPDVIDGSGGSPDSDRPSESNVEGRASDVDGGAVDLTEWLTAQLRAAQRDVDMCRAAMDQPGVARARRDANTIAALLQKQAARNADDGDVIRVKTSDVVAAKERVRAKLFDLADRFREDVAKGRS